MPHNMGDKPASSARVGRPGRGARRSTARADRPGHDHSGPRIGLDLPATLSFQGWMRVGRQIALTTDSSAWWLADWLLFGESHFSDRYRKAIDETSLDYQTLRNYAWVGRRFERSRRRDRLSFQHHSEVAALPREEQDLWLDRAELGGWSRTELRRQLRAYRKAGLEPAEQSIELRLAVSTQQWQRWLSAAGAAALEVTDWAVRVLDAFAR